jgi:hypothetical protein
MNRAQKSTITGALLAAGVFIFIPKAYAKLAGMVGKIVEVKEA